MSELTRRRFLVRSSVGMTAAVAGAMAALPAIEALAGAPAPAGALPVAPPAPLVDETLVLHVRDVAAGEVALTAGTAETVYRDRELVARLVARVRAMDGAAGTR